MELLWIKLIVKWIVVIWIHINIHTGGILATNCFSDSIWQSENSEIPQGGAYINCKTACEGKGHPYSGLKRNGDSAAYAQCYCGSDVPVDRCTSCSYTCGGYPCGQHPGCMSIYSVVYPLCLPLSWDEVDCTVYGDPDCAGFPEGRAISSCQTHCRKTAMKKFYGVRRNGPDGGKARCYCGDSVDGLVDEGLCPHRCSGLPCGNADTDRMSVYPVCPEGKYGLDCNQECFDGYCKDFICDVNTGLCPAECIDGWYGDNCNTACSVNCEGSCDNSGNCQGCNPGFHGNQCNQNCSRNCVDQICDQQSAECTNGCKDGSFGPKCEQQCPANCDGACDRNTGDCSACEDGWFGPRCQDPCPTNCATMDCTFSGGFCSACKPSWYTDKCDSNCPPNCYEDICEFNSGDCPRCEDDTWFDGECSQRCAEGCNNTICLQNNGTCLYGCTVEFYGDRCESRCPDNCDGGCNKVNGSCFACRTGWSGNKCNQDIDECSDGGSNTCNSTSDCYNIPGSYKCCNTDDIFDNTTAECKQSSVEGGGPLEGGAIAGIVIGILVIIALSVVLAIILTRKRRQKPPATQSTATEQEGQENPAFASIPKDFDFEEPLKPAASAAEAPIASEKPAILRPKPVKIRHTLDYQNNPHKLPSTVQGFSVPVAEFKQYFNSKKSVNKLLENEYESLPTGQLYEWKEASRDKSLKLKNRYIDIYPYDYNRVVLKLINEDPLSDYINASRIDGYMPEDKFIATLGTRPATLEDFWRMAWQENVETIVMVTNLVELGTQKCDRYWPEFTGQSATFGIHTVTLVMENELPTYTIRKLHVTESKERRQITQLHFTAWPDKSIPNDGTALLNFRRKVLPHLRPNIPTIVHCSAGVGRTGTFIAVDSLIKQATKEGKVDVYNFIRHLRNQRKHMVQTADQYVFIHEALDEYFTVGNTVIPLDGFRARFTALLGKASHGESILHKQYKILGDMAPVAGKLDREEALADENKHKNRNLQILPYLSRRVFLLSHVKGRTSYINAVKVDGFLKKNGYYVTQLPLKDTAIDFWRMVNDSESYTIVMLITKSQSREIPNFLPAKNCPMDAYDSVASVRSSLTKGPYRVLDVSLASKSTPPVPLVPVINQEESEYMNVGDYRKSIVQDGNKNMKVFEILVAEGQGCLDPALVRDVFLEAQKWQKENDNKPIIVTCLDGAKYSGQYVACCNIFEMISADQEVDVFQVAKYVRDSRPEFIGTLDQYRALHEAALMFLMENQTYENIN